MNQTRIISKILFYICCILSAGYLITFVYSILCLATDFSVVPYKDGQYLHINYPFTESPFLNIENNHPYIMFSFLLVLISYGIFSGFLPEFSGYSSATNYLRKKI